VHEPDAAEAGDGDSDATLGAHRSDRS
jgi:hypothetical protein